MGDIDLLQDHCMSDCLTTHTVKDSASASVRPTSTERLSRGVTPVEMRGTS